MSYFDSLLNLQATLKQHGFDHFPAEEELVILVLELGDKLDALYSALKLKPVRDCRDRWKAQDSDAPVMHYD